MYETLQDTADSIISVVGLTIFYSISIAMVVVAIIGTWKIYSKAGVPGWGSLILFYNIYLWFKIGLGNGWWFLLVLIPFVGWIAGIVATYKVCVNFGRGFGFFIGMVLLPFIFYLILGFGSAQYKRIDA